MTFFAYQGTLLCPSTFGNVSYTDPGFQPKCLIFWTSNSTSAADSADAGWGIGFTSPTGSNRTRSLSQHAANNVSTIATDGRTSLSPWVIWHQSASTQLLTAQFTSFDATGFTLNWSSTTTGAFVHYLALGGTDLSVMAGTTTATGATGPQAITGVGFQPKLVLFMGNSTVSTPAGAGFGAATSPTARWAVSMSAASGGTMSSANSASRVQDTTKCIALLNGAGATTFNYVADLQSMDSDGFTLNWTTASGAGMSLAWLAFGGTAEFSVGSFTKAANTTETSISVNAGLSSTPSAYLIASTVATSNTAQSTGWRAGFGVTDGTRANSINLENKNTVLPTQARKFSDGGGNSSVYRQRALPASVSAPGATEVEFDHSAFTANGFTVSLPVNTVATAYIYPYITFGAPVAPGALTGSAAGVATVNETLSVKRALAGTSAGVATTTRAGFKRSVTGASAGVATASGTIQRVKPLSGASAGAASVSVTLSRRRSLSASSAGVATVSVTLGRKRSLVISAAGVATATGTISKQAVTKDLTGSAAGVASTSGQVGRRRSLVAASAGTSSVSVTLTRRRSLSAASAGQATVSVALTARRSLQAASAGTATTTATLAARRSLVAASAGVAVASGVVTKLQPGLNALAGGKATTTATLSARRVLVASAAGQASVTVLLTRRRSLVAASAGAATTTALVRARRSLLAASAGVATTTGLVRARRSLTAASAGAATTTALVRARRSLLGASAGQASTSGTLTPPVAVGGIQWSGTAFQNPGGSYTPVLWASGAFRTASGAVVFWHDGAFQLAA